MTEPEDVLAEMAAGPLICDEGQDTPEAIDGCATRCQGASACRCSKCSAVEALREKVVRRYLTDAEFHAHVYLAATFALETAGWDAANEADALYVALMSAGAAMVRAENDQMVTL